MRNDEYLIQIDDDDAWLVPAEDCTDDVGGFWYDDGSGYEDFYADIDPAVEGQYDFEGSDEEDDEDAEDLDDSEFDDADDEDE